MSTLDFETVTILTTAPVGDRDEYTFGAGSGISILEPAPGSDAPQHAWLDDAEIPVEDAWAMLEGRIHVRPPPENGTDPSRGDPR